MRRAAFWTVGSFAHNHGGIVPSESTQNFRQRSSHGGGPLLFSSWETTEGETASILANPRTVHPMPLRQWRNT